MKEYTDPKPVHISARPHPLKDEVLTAQANAGQTIYEVLGDIREQAVVFHNGEIISHEDLDSVVLAEDDVVNVAVTARGGDDGNKVLRTVLQVAVVAATLAVDVIFPGAGRLLQAGIAAAISVGGTMLVNAIVPPPEMGLDQSGNSEEFNRIGGLTGARNRLVPYGPVPRVYGRHKMYPPMAAKPFTEIQSNVQYLHMLMCVGYGPVRLHNPKIGDTVIGSFDSNNNFTPNGNFESVSIDVGENPRFYTNDVDENGVSVTMNEGAGSFIRTTVPDTDSAGIDFLFPRGLFAINEDGDTIGATVEFKIEYRETGTSTWTNALESDNSDENDWDWEIDRDFGDKLTNGGGSSTETDPVFSVSGNERETLRNGVNIHFPSRGQYDIRVTRTYSLPTQDANEDTQVFNDTTWTVLRSITYEEPTDLPGVAMIGMRIRATDQLTGVLDNFSVEVESRLATYDTGTNSWNVPTFDPATGDGSGGALTSNPAWVYADVLAGDANARALDRSDLDGATLKDWADFCNTEGFEYNSPGDSKTNVFELAKTVASAGRASYGVVDGQFTVVQDRPQSTPRQMFTPRNSWNFSSQRQFPKVPHGIKVRFIDPANGWQENERIVYDDGYTADNATRFEVLDLAGVTDPDQAWKMGRYYLAAMRLRPEVYTLEVDVEHITCTRGDLVRVAYDVPLWGLAQGRIKSLTKDGNGDVTEITVDEPCIMESGKDYVVSIRTDKDFSVTEGVATQAGSQTTLTLDNPIPAADNVSKGNLFAFGEKDVETVDLKVLSIEPRENLNARLTFVDAAPEILESGILPEDFDASNVDTSTDTVTAKDGEHRLYNGDVVQLTTTGSLPSPLQTGTDYYIVGRTDSIFQLSETEGGSVIDITDQGTGTHTATRQIPEYQSNITEPTRVDEIIPPKPRIENIRSDENTNYRDNDGSFLLNIHVDFTLDKGFPAAKVEGRYRKKDVSDGWVGYKTVDASNGVLTFSGVERGKDYILQLRTVNFDQESEWVSIPISWDAITDEGDQISLGGDDTLLYEDDEGHFVVGKKFPPRDVKNFTAVIDKTNVRLSWDAVNSPDIQEYEIREGLSFETGDLVDKTDATVLSVEIDGSTTRHFHIKAIDTSGNYSEKAASKEIVIPNEFDELGNWYSYIKKTANEIVLKVQSDGSLAKVAVQGDPDTGGTKIEINADQIAINNINFDKDAGTIASDNFDAGKSGWQIKGSGDAEFNNVTVRGVLGANKIKGDIENDGGDFLINEDGFAVKTASGWSPEKAYVIVNDAVDPNDVIGGVYGNTVSVRLYATDGKTATIDSERMNFSGIARFANTLTTISGGVLDIGVTATRATFRSFVTINNENGDATDDLTTIQIEGNATPKDGTILILEANENAGQTTTIEDGTGNIDLAVGNITLGAGNDRALKLIYSENTDTWKEIS